MAIYLSIISSSYRQAFLFSLVFFLSSGVHAHHQVVIPRLSAFDRTTSEYSQNRESSSSSSFLKENRVFFFNQTLDHFNYKPESYMTFAQKYVINSKYWGGPDAPILAYLGEEVELDMDLVNIGFLPDNAERFKALVVYIEHRYYGDSIPFNISLEKALKDANIRGYFSSAQALTDYATILMHVKNKFNATKSPTIVIGGSYGGMLASWFRLKYPHLAVGALASSAPILYFDKITPQDGYYDVVTEDFREASEACYESIKASWLEIDGVASQPDGLSKLSIIFKTCQPLTNSSVLKDYLLSMYASAAQYNRPPTYPVALICNGINNATSSNTGSSTDILERIFAGVVARKGNLSCYVNEPKVPSQTDIGYNWQRCSEMVMPIGITNNSMLPSYPFNLTTFIEDCKRSYGVVPRPHWITTYYGGYDIKLILKRFGSNIIFSNGLRDPYSSGGVLNNISDTILAITTVNGSHCLDLLPSKPSDPDWLVMQRKIEVEIIQSWVEKYYMDIRILKDH